MAPIIPPGIGFILYGTVGQVSIGRLFAAGIMPGPDAVGGARDRRSRSRRASAATRRSATSAPTLQGDRASRSWGGIWAILFPIILLLGLRFGVFTPSEIGAFAVIYAVVDRLLRLSHADAARASARRWKAAWSMSARSCSCSRCRRSSATASCSSASRRSISDWMLGITDSRQRRDGDDRALHPGRRDLHGRLGADHHADADLPAAGARNTASIRCISGWSSSSPRPSAITRRRWARAMFVVCQVLRCPIGEYTRESMPFLIAVSARDAAADLRARGRAVRAGPDLRQVLTTMAVDTS